MRALIRKSDGYIYEGQGDDAASLDVLLANAETNGMAVDTVEPVVIPDAEFWTRIAAQDDADAAAAKPSDPSAYSAEVQKLIDATAQARQYADGVSLASYKNSSNATWSAEATAFIIWRDAVWQSTYATLAAVQAGTTQQPTIAELLASLPTINWPA